MNYADLQKLYAGQLALELFDTIVQNNKLFQDIQYELTNDGAALKFVNSGGLDVGVGEYGSTKANLSGLSLATLTAKMLEALSIVTIPLSMYQSAPDKNTLTINQIKSALNWTSLKAVSQMLGYVDGNIASAKVGFYDDWHDPSDDDYKNVTWIDAGGTPDANGLTDVWLVRWATDGAVIGLTANMNELLAIKQQEPYVTNVVDTNGKALPTVCIPIVMNYAPAIKRPNAVIRIANLNHPLKIGAKLLTEELLLKAIGLLDSTQGGTISIILHPTQYTAFLQNLTSKTNLMQINTDGNINTAVLSYNGCIFRPTESVIYHSKTS